MIVETAALRDLAGPITMVDGGFDPLHDGHIAYFRAAAALGAPVLCNVSGDDWVGRKHPPLLEQSRRVLVIDALRDVAYTHLSSISTAEVLRLLRPHTYAKGLDWEGRLPDDELAACADSATDVVYLDTVLGSSSELLARYELSRRDADASA